MGSEESSNEKNKWNVKKKEEIIVTKSEARGLLISIFVFKLFLKLFIWFFPESKNMPGRNSAMGRKFGTM